MMEITAKEQNKERRMKRIEDSFRDLWDNIKCTNIWIIGSAQEEEKKKGSKKIFEEIIVEKFPNMEKEISTQDQEVQRVPYNINMRRNTLGHKLIKLTKIKLKKNCPNKIYLAGLLQAWNESMCRLTQSLALNQS